MYLYFIDVETIAALNDGLVKADKHYALSFGSMLLKTVAYAYNICQYSLFFMP